MRHIELGLEECRQATNADKSYDSYLCDLRCWLGVDDLDGDENEDGYSLDTILCAYESGISAYDYASGVRA